jgi:hypothetical protein
METAPWGAIYRVVIGCVVPFVVELLWGESHSGFLLMLALLGALLSLRVVPFIVRKLIPFSTTARTAWIERRQLAKRYDSYQWQKLFWIGVGLTLYTIIPGKLTSSGIAISSLCLLSGALGLFIWRNKGRQIGSRKARID